MTSGLKVDKLDAKDFKEDVMQPDMTFGTLSAKRGEKVCTEWQIEQAGFSIPATLICGSRPGKTVLITGGIHSCEYVGIQAAIELSQKLKPEQVCGTVLLLHPVNRFGFEARTPSIVPQDGCNLNREFPGKPDGSLTQRLAYFLTQQIYPKLDAYIDLHCGEMFESLTPYVYYAGAGTEQTTQHSRRMAELVSVPYMVQSQAVSGAYNCAGLMGIPSILIERGCQGMWTQQQVQEDVDDVLRILAHLGVVDSVPEQKEHPNEVTDLIYQMPQSEGLWYPQVREGEFVKAGQQIGVIRDYWGNELSCYHAPYDGVVLYLTHTLWVDGKVEIYTIARKPD